MLLLAAAVLAGAPGCSGSDQARGPDGRKRIHAYLLLISTRQVDYYKWAEKTFEARNPNVDVVIEQFPGSSLKDYEIKLRLRYSSGQAPDVFFIQTDLLSELVSLGLAEPAPPFIDSLVQAEGRTEMIRRAPYFGGTGYGMTASASPTVLYYNKDMFREAGLDPDRPPRTWEELIDYAERLTRRDADGNVTRAGLSLRKRGYKPGTAGKWFTFLFSAGGEAFDGRGRRARFNSEAGREALDLYDTVLFEKNLDAIGLQGDQQGFGQEKAAMFIREVHVVRWLQENYPDVDFGVAPLPKRDTSLSSGTPYVWTVSSQTPHPTASWRFVEFLMSKEAYARYASIGGVVPVTRSVAQMPEYAEDPYLKVFLDQRMKAPEVFPRLGRAEGILGAYIERFCYGRMGVDETLRRAADNVNALLARPPRGGRVPASAGRPPADSARARPGIASSASSTSSASVFSSHD
jgi:ABC-type glycerol-3-phosphate transport system substrate-binding protein